MFIILTIGWILNAYLILNEQKIINEKSSYELLENNIFSQDYSSQNLEQIDISQRTDNQNQFKDSYYTLDIQTSDSNSFNDDDQQINKNDQINESNQIIQHSLLTKYQELLFTTNLSEPINQDIKQQESQQSMIENRIIENNPLKLFLLYSEQPLQENDEISQKILSNEEIIEQLSIAKQEQVNKMQSLIIKQLKEQKPIQNKKTFLEEDFIEWEMKN